MILDFSKETEWYENVRNGFVPLCDRCNDNINRDEFFTQRNQRGVYCEKCWNWIHLKRGKCEGCGSVKTHRGYQRILPMTCNCGGLIWLK